jgi:hypothetical protein
MKRQEELKDGSYYWAKWKMWSSDEWVPSKFQNGTWKTGNVWQSFYPTQVGDEIHFPKTTREPGFYWVRLDGDDWEVAQFNGDGWFVVDRDIKYREAEVGEVDERRLTRETD